MVWTPCDAVEAQRAGADRVELVCAIEHEGLTPTPGLIRVTKGACSVPVFAMVQPRTGDYVHSAAEFEVMLADVAGCIEAGAAGVVVGCLNESGTLDLGRMRKLQQAAQGKPCACHRAFDLTPSANDALDALIDLGYARVLTTGHAKSAVEGSSNLAHLIERAAGRIEVMPGGGVRHQNVQEIVRTSGCASVHLGPRKVVGVNVRLNEEEIAATRAALDQL